MSEGGDYEEAQLAEAGTKEVLIPSIESMGTTLRDVNESVSAGLKKIGSDVADTDQSTAEPMRNLLGDGEKAPQLRGGEPGGPVEPIDESGAPARPGTAPAGGGDNTLGGGDPAADANAPGSGAASKDPVDLVTGEMFLPQTDLQLPGLLPLILERTHRSAFRRGRWFGPTWASTLDQRIETDAEGVHYAAPDGVVLHYPQPDRPGSPVLPVEGARWPLAWDRNSDLIRIEQPERGLILEFPPGPTPQRCRPLAAVADQRGNRITFLVDDEGLPTRVVCSSGYVVSVDTVSTTAGSRISGLRLTGTAMGIDAAGDGPASVDLPVAEFRYDARGRLVEVADPEFAPLEFTYDDQDRITAWTDRNGHTFRYEYDSGSGRVVRADGSGGFLSARFAYDAAAGITTATDSLGHRTVYQWDELGHVVAVTGPDGAVTRTEQDRYGRILSQTDALGNTVRYLRNEHGDPLRIERPDGTAIDVRYDEHRHAVQVSGPDGAQWRYRYDEHGGLTAVLDPTGAVTAFAYDERGALQSMTDPLGHAICIEPGPAGLARSASDARGSTTGFEYDAFGRLSATTDTLGGRSSTGWTPQGRIGWTVSQAGERHEWQYDGEGNVVGHSGPAGTVTLYEYGPFDQVTARTDPDGRRFAFAYDTELRLTTVTGPDGRTWDYVYDPCGRLIRESDFDGRAVSYTHDAAGGLAERVNGAGERTTFRRDAFGRAVERRTEQTVHIYHYDVNGLIQYAEGPDGDLEYRRDPLGRVIEETINGRTTHYAYDAAGRRVRRVTPAGIRTEWTLDEAGLPLTLAGSAGTMYFQHDAAGRETARRIGPLAALTQTYDSVGRLIGHVLWSYDQPGQASARRIGGRGYSYRPDGYLAEIVDDHRGSTRYTTDPVGRVTALDAAGWTESYAYDALGNIAHADLPGEPDAVGSRDVSGTLVRRAGRIRYDYDAQGRVTRAVRRTLSGQSRQTTYTWDGDDRLMEVGTPDGDTWSYTYDPLGRRTAKRRVDAAGQVREHVWFTWDGPRPAEQTTFAPDGTATALTWDYHPGTHRLAAQTRSSWQPDAAVAARRDFHCVVADPIGTPIELVGEDGAVVWQRRTTLWGAPAAGATASDTLPDCPLGFPGQYRDDETGLHYNYLRYYDPDAGAYLSPDPLGLRAAPNNHGYVKNPTVCTDPYGLAPCYLTQTGPDTYESPAGLVYGPDPSPNFASRVDHVLNHNTDIPVRPQHGVFGAPDSDENEVFRNIDEAYQKAQNGDAITLQQGTKTVHYVNMGRDVGLIGGVPGAATGNPTVQVIQLVLQGRNVITAFPVAGLPMPPP